MKPVPVLLCLLPEDGYVRRTYAKDQPPYLPLPTIIKEDGTLVTQWQPDANDLALLNNGAPITITILETPYWNPRMPLLPMKVEAGGTDLQ